MTAGGLSHYERLQEIEQVCKLFSKDPAHDPLKHLKACQQPEELKSITPTLQPGCELQLQRVVHAIEAASFVMSEMAKEREQIDKAVMHAAATSFLQQIQEAQQFVLEAIKSAAPDRHFEANNYYLLLQAVAAAEKLDAVSVHISGMTRVLQEHQQQQLATSALSPLTADAGPMLAEDEHRRTST